jgi:hypothetical protein
MFLEKRDFSTSRNFCRGMLCLRASVQNGPRGRNRTGLQHKTEENPMFREKRDFSTSLNFPPRDALFACKCATRAARQK